VRFSVRLPHYLRDFPFILRVGSLLDAAYFHAQTDHEAALFKSQIPVIVALIKGCKSGKVVRDRNDIPGGCTSALVSHTLAVYTLIQVRYRFPFSEYDAVDVTSDVEGVTPVTFTLIRSFRGL
jgi:hypothetical protein